MAETSKSTGTVAAPTEPTRTRGMITKAAAGYNYNYADMTEVHDYLASTKQTYYQFIDTIVTETGVFDYVMTQRQIIKDDGTVEDNGKPLRGARVISSKLSGKSNEAQELGSGITYARRYSLMLAFGLAAEDDDGESLTTKGGRASAPKPVARGGSKTQYDFSGVRARIRAAESREAVESIFKSIPAPLQQYFVSDCKDRVDDLGE